MFVKAKNLETTTPKTENKVFFANRSIDKNSKMDARLVDRGLIGSYKPEITDAILLDT